MMTRRDFLKVLGLAAGAATFVELQALVPIPPEAIGVDLAAGVDWTAYCRIEIELRDGVPRWKVNGLCVNVDPAMVKKVSRIVTAHGGTLAPVTFVRDIPIPGEVDGFYAACGYQEIITDPRGRYAVYDVGGHLIPATIPNDWL